MELQPPDLCLIKLSHPIRTHIYYRKHRPLVRTSQGWSGAAGVGQLLGVMDDGTELCLKGVSTRWWRMIRVNNGHPRFLLYLLGFVSIRELQWWCQGCSSVHENPQSISSDPSIFLEHFLHSSVSASKPTLAVTSWGVWMWKRRQVLSCGVLISSCPRSQYGRQCLWPDL